MSKYENDEGTKTTIPLERGGTLTLHEPDSMGYRTVTINHPDAPEDMKDLEVGRIVSLGNDTGIQMSLPFTMSGAALSSDSLRVIAEFTDRVEDFQCEVDRDV